MSSGDSLFSVGHLNDRRLREESLKAFVKALHTDRMVAVTGSLSTYSLGYPSGSEFVKVYGAVAGRLVEEIIKDRGAHPALAQTSAADILDEIRRRADTLERGQVRHMDGRVGMWSLHEAFRVLDALMRHNRVGLVIGDHYQTPALERFEARLARVFRARSLGVEPFQDHAESAAIAPMIASLGIKRIATLNYDLELERAFMLREDEREILKAALKASQDAPGSKDRSSAFAARSEARTRRLSVERFIGAASSGKPILRGERGHLSRTMGNGVTVESDIVDRERPDRLFEFATGSAVTDRHILHLHGRADHPRSLIANIRQYDRLYRLDDQYRDPFDHGLRLLFGGNPILFVGIGMNEDEINRTLQYFVSNAPVRRPSPMFLLWNTSGMQEDWKTEIENRRLDFRTRLGVQVLFDQDLEDIARAWPKASSALGQLGSALSLAAVTGDRKPVGDLLTDLAPPAPTEQDRAKGLATLLKALPGVAERVDRRLLRRDRWRSASKRWGEPDKDKDLPVRLWGGLELARMVAKQPAAIDRLAQPSGPDGPRHASLIFIAGAPGTGRGALGERLIQMERAEVVIGDHLLAATERRNRLLVNAGFSYDSDAMLTGIATFLDARREQPCGERLCRERAFADGSLFDTREQTLVVINGADRFFGFDGTPLSAELDHMLRSASRHTGVRRVQFVLLCTQRLHHYCEAIGAALQPLQDGPIQPPEAAPTDPPGPGATRYEHLSVHGSPPPSVYLSWVATKFKTRRGALVSPDERTWEAADITPAAAVNIERALNFNREAFSRTFFDAYLSPALLQALGIACPATFEVLRTMSFIGSPMEGVVLLCAPKVWAILAEDQDGRHVRDADEVRQRLERVLRDLLDLGLIIQLEGYAAEESQAAGPDGPSAATSEEHPGALLGARFGLHRSLAAYLRDRHGAPINDAKLSTTFNMSLFMSDPGDSYTPEHSFHDELGHLVDSLIGAWHDIGRVAPQSLVLSGEGDIDEAVLADLYIHFGDREHALTSVSARAGAVASACLRAALSLVRSYYSTGALLKFDRDERVAVAGRDGALTEHAQRLDRLITAFGDVAISRKILREQARGSDAAKRRHLGPEPFYPDDLVWLFNERGVVALTQGHLFDARDAFRAADTVNQSHVERSHRGHNWRRIALNLVATRIERSALKPAERLLDEIEATVDRPVRPEGRAEPGDRVSFLRRRPWPDEGPLRGDARFSREEVLVVAMATGYRGLIAHLRGHYREAGAHYATATDTFRRLGEHRAFAHFQRHYATLQMFVGDRDAASREIEYAIITAQSAAQMDILHRARVVRANVRRGLSDDPVARRHNLQDIKDALRYAALADCYRVRIEASASLARHMRHSGDYDTALRYAVDALTIASRYGHSLQKTSLRIEIGQILAARGDPRSGKAMLDKAAKIGADKGHYQANERVQRARTTIAATSPLPNRTDISISN
jgi:tetratricopeptide (TPR) repeat protein